MKKLQNFLMKPQSLKKKLQSASFRHDFIEWSRNNIQHTRDSHSKHYRSKSPTQNQKSLHALTKKHPTSQSKQNIRCLNNMRPSSNSKKKINYRVEETVKYSSQQNLTNQAYQNYKRVNNPNKPPQQDKNCRSVSHKYSRSTSALYEQNNRKTRCNSALAIGKPILKSAESSLMEVSDSENIINFTYSYRTKQGVLASNPNKTNQDSLLVKTKILDRNSNLFVVADGHGAYGHLVSQNLVKNMNKYISQYFKKYQSHEALSKMYDLLQKSLTNSQINANCSGSTLVSVHLQNNVLTCANVGDSRAILARQIDRKSWEMIYLSQDHKPSVQAQKKRILKNGGRVHSYKDENGQPLGPLRVWLPNQNIQGLAMTRSLGDNVSKSVGVIHNPEIIQLTIDKRDKFILLASDGVWQFITNHEVLQLVVPYYRQNKLEEACDALMKLAYQRWTVQDNSVIDDITFILIFFNA